jgi:Glycosyltransferase family 87
LKGIDNEKKCIMCYIALLDMLTCMQGTQTNVMIGVLMVLAFLSFENKKYWIAAFAIAAGAYIKIYPIVAASLFLLYPDKIKFILRFVVAMIVIGLLPLLFVKPHELVTLYHNWYAELVIDQGDNYGKISLTGLIQAYFHISDFGKLLVQIGGVFLFCLMYVRYKLFESYNFRLYFLGAILIWVTIFNHASEIYGYAIAIWGVGIWYALQKPSKVLNIFMVLFVFFGTFLSIDPTPHIILDYIYEHGLKALPFTIMFGVIVWEMLKGKSDIFNLENKNIS